MRHETPTPGDPFKSEYDISSQEIDDLVKRAPIPVNIFTVNLDAAGTLIINDPGYGFVVYGFKRLDGSKYAAAFVQIAVDQIDTLSDPSRVFPAKGGRGFYGFFSKLAVSWPTDPNGPGNSAQIVVFKSKQYPWTGGKEAT